MYKFIKIVDGIVMGLQFSSKPINSDNLTRVVTAEEKQIISDSEEELDETAIVFDGEIEMGSPVVNNKIKGKTLEMLRTEKLERYREKTSERIDKLSWRFAQITRHLALGREPKKTLNEIYVMQQSLEDRYDAAEIELNAYTEISDVRAHRL